MRKGALIGKIHIFSNIFYLVCLPEFIFNLLHNGNGFEMYEKRPIKVKSKISCLLVKRSNVILSLSFLEVVFPSLDIFCKLILFGWAYDPPV